MTVSKAKDRERVEIENDHKVSRSTIQGWFSILLGFPIAGVGICILMVRLGNVKMSAKDIYASGLWGYDVVVAIFILTGMVLIVHGFLGLGRKARMKNGKRIQPNRPWLWDYPWESLGITENKLKQVFSALGATAFLIGIMVPQNWLVFYSDKVVSFWAKGMVVVFDIVLLLTFCDFVRKLMQYFKYGNSRLRFNAFPFHLGDKLSVKLVDLPREINRLCMDLRFIEEQYVTRWYGSNKEVACHQLYHENRTLTGSQASSAGVWDMVWDLPNEAELSTALSQRPARFWELEVRADTPGVDYHSRFLLPVYPGGS